MGCKPSADMEHIQRRAGSSELSLELGSCPAWLRQSEGHCRTPAPTGLPGTLADMEPALPCFRPQLGKWTLDLGRVSYICWYLVKDRVSDQEATCCFEQGGGESQQAQQHQAHHEVACTPQQCMSRLVAWSCQPSNSTCRYRTQQQLGVQLRDTPALCKIKCTSSGPVLQSKQVVSVARECKGTQARCTNGWKD